MYTLFCENNNIVNQSILSLIEVMFNLFKVANAVLFGQTGKMHNFHHLVISRNYAWGCISTLIKESYHYALSRYMTQAAL